MKVYIVYYIPDYIGIDIVKIFTKESDAKKYCEDYNKNVPHWDRYNYEEYDVE